MIFERLVALRYLKAKRREKFISLISFISIAGIAVGVMALLVVIGVMTGFDQDLRNKILSVNAHIILLKPGYSLTDYDDRGPGGGICPRSGVRQAVYLYPGHVLRSEQYLRGRYPGPGSAHH